MTKKPATSARKPRKSKYFKLRESNSSGMDNAWWVYKKRNGFYLWASESGVVGGPCETISEALGWDGNGYGGEYVEIDTNVPLEELFEIMTTNSFEPLLHNLYRLHLNGVEIDAQSFKNFVIWYAQCQKASPTKKTGPIAFTT